MSLEHLTPEQRKTLYDINSRLMKEDGVLPNTVESVGSTIASLPRTEIPETRDWGKSVAEIDLFLHHLTNRGGELVEWEVGSVLEPLLRQRDLAVRRELAHDKHQHSHPRKGRNRWGTLVFAAIPTIALLATTTLAIDSHTQYQEAELLLLADPNYRLSQSYSRISDRLKSASTQLGGDGQGPHTIEAKQSLGGAIEELESNDLPTIELERLQIYLQGAWQHNPSKAEFVANPRASISATAGEMDIKARISEQKAPADLLFKRDNSWTRFLGWGGVSGALALIALAQALPKDLYRRMYNNLKGSTEGS